MPRPSKYGRPADKPNGLTCRRCGVPLMGNYVFACGPQCRKYLNRRGIHGPTPLDPNGLKCLLCKAPLRGTQASWCSPDCQRKGAALGALRG